MAQYKLTTYIERLESLYKKAREDYNKAIKSLNELEDSHRKKISSGELNAIGVQKEGELYNTKKREYLDSIAAARDTFTTSAAEIRQAVDTLFSNLYRVDPASIDLKAVEILKSGMLTQTELLEMATKYKEQGNLAMYRYCGTFADEKYSPETRSLAGAAKMALQRTDLQQIDSFIDMCLKGLRDDVDLADGIDKHHEEWLQSYLQEAEEITATVDTPWDN